MMNFFSALLIFKTLMNAQSGPTHAAQMVFVRTRLEVILANVNLDIAVMDVHVQVNFLKVKI